MNILYNNRTVNFPDFMIIGAAKSGSSSLNYWLEDHPDIFMATPKEPNFFAFANHPGLYDDMRELAERVSLHNYDFDQYTSLFRDSGHLVSGEASTAYLQFPDSTISNLKKYYGSKLSALKLILLLRNPVEKIFSHYLMFVKWGVESRAFRDAVMPDYYKAHNVYEEQIDYLSGGYYHDHVEKYLSTFGDNLKIILFEDLVADPRSVVSEVLDFIGTGSSTLPGNLNKKYNVGGVPRNRLARRFYLWKKGDGFLKRCIKSILPETVLKPFKRGLNGLADRLLLRKPKISKEEREFLKGLYRDDITRTSSLIGRELGHWLD